MKYAGPYTTITQQSGPIQMAIGHIVSKRELIIDSNQCGSYNIWKEHTSSGWYWHPFDAAKDFYSLASAKQSLDTFLIDQGYTIIDDTDRWDKLKLLL